MREELNEEFLNSVAGGRAYINTDQNKIAFRDAKRVFKLNEGCSVWQVAALCDSLRGKYPTEEEYDNACIEALQAQGWI